MFKTPWAAKCTLQRNGNFILHDASLKDCVRRWLECSRRARSRLYISSGDPIANAPRSDAYILLPPDIADLAGQLPDRGPTASILPFPVAR